MDTEDVERDLTLPKKAKSLLNQTRMKEIKQEEFDKEIAYWGLQFLDDYRFRPMPTMPKSLKDVLNERRGNPNSKIRDDFWKQAEIVNYLQQTSRLYAENASNYTFLIKMKNALPQEDTISISKIQPYINDYTPFLNEKKTRQYDLPNYDLDKEEIKREFWG